MKMKMSDVFELPVNGACVHVNFHKLKDNYNDGVTPFDAIDIAINNHDRLNSENARLMDMLKRLTSHDNCRKDVIHLMSEADSLIQELEKGDE